MTDKHMAGSYEAPAIFEIGSLHELTQGPIVNKNFGAFDGVQLQGVNIGVPS